MDKLITLLMVVNGIQIIFFCLVVFAAFRTAEKDETKKIIQSSDSTQSDAASFAKNQAQRPAFIAGVSQVNPACAQCGHTVARFNLNSANQPICLNCQPAQ